MQCNVQTLNLAEEAMLQPLSILLGAFNAFMLYVLALTQLQDLVALYYVSFKVQNFVIFFSTTQPDSQSVKVLSTEERVHS